MSPGIPDSGDMEQRGVSSLLGTARSTSEPISLSCLSGALFWPICHDLGGSSQIKISEIKLSILMEEEKHSWIFQVICGLNKINGFHGFINNKNAIRWQPYHTSLLCLWQSSCVPPAESLVGLSQPHLSPQRPQGLIHPAQKALTKLPSSSNRKTSNIRWKFIPGQDV